MRIPLLLEIVVLLVLYPGQQRVVAQSTSCTLQPTKNIFWNSLTGNNGLSQNSVTSIIQDTRGFIWIGTYDGLNRFDGFTTQVKRHESANKNSLSDNRILCLQENSLGNIVIGTDGGGLNIFDPGKDYFRHISLSTGKTGSDMILSLSADNEGNTWIGTSSGLFHVNDQKFTQDTTKPELIPGFENTSVSKIICDKGGNTWIGTDRGLFIIRAGKIQRKQPNWAELVKSVGQSPVTALYQDARHNIWIGKSGGLFTAGYIADNAANELIITDRSKGLLPPDITPLDISDITMDLSGNLWISSRNRGLFKFTQDNTGKFVRSGLYNTDQPFCNIAEDRIRVVFTDRSNTLWVGTYRKGVNYSSISGKNFYAFNPLLSPQKGEFGYKGKYITTVAEKDKALWIGTDEEGLYKYNACTGNLTSSGDLVASKNIICIFPSKTSLWVGTDTGLYQVTSGQKSKLLKAGTAIRSICGDNFGRLWLASWQGIMIYDPVTQTTDTLTVARGLSSNTCFTVYSERVENVIWVGTIGGGLNRITYNAKGADKFFHYRNDPKNAHSISNNHVWCTYRDKQEVLWVGTDAGLNRCFIDRTTGIARFEPISHPLLKDRKITAILEDEEKNLWLSSSQGLFRYDVIRGEVRQYTYRDGLQSNNFTEAAFKDGDGRMYFGGINGLNYFDPSQIKSNPYLPSTAIVDFEIFNKSIVPGEKVDGRTILDSNINNTRQIILSYRQNNFMFSFAALQYAVPEDNRFRYKLEGYDKNWIVTGHDHRFAAYSNLDVGDYTFLFSSSNNDGIWNPEVKSIRIIIEPAPWFTWWAKSIYVLAMATLAWIVF
ncbi:MAG: two-component regulator propeller domain-containing protein, partial [Ferruginibacter sp.]